MRTAIIIFIILFFIPVIGFSATLKVPSQYQTIQDAIDVAVNGDTVLVAPGTYNELINFLGKAIKVMSEQGADFTIIDGNRTDTVVRCHSGEGSDSVLEGFSITNGYPGSTTCAGMYNGNSSPTVMNCIFYDNVGWIGGGMANEGSSPTVTNCAFIGNKAYPNWMQGGIGGGMANANSSPTVTNCTFTENSAQSGGGMFNYYSNPTVTNCTFSGNSSEHSAGGMYNGDSSPTVTNCIFWDSTPDEIYGTTIVTYSNVKGGWSGTGNIDSDPLFVDPTNNDFHLTFNSPCRGSGDNSAILDLYDFEGDPRIAYGTVDMGADEFYTHLYWTGDATPGGNVEVKFVGLPGTAPVQLWLGSDVMDPPMPTVYGDWYLQFPLLASVGLGSIPAPDGVLVLPFTFPVSAPTPLSLPFQAGVGMELTNLSVLEVK